ncbi:hypothetical protein HTZ77_31860 [Nonomuraea sp. SMC257]|uniref:Uncharacterized protein n=1 Tax=Nonomuraea montanisoli TaxID=2741721 RepID=A0A7Y6ID76_9ACTN|nr:hypothetical protein [Nonomuraea montanisoli]NUW35981.1 hypothetical protein [Nonomuraea montanisoli]
MRDIDEIDELLRPLARIAPDEPGGRAGGARARALFADIIAQERDAATTVALPRRPHEGRRGRRALLGLAASAVLALGVVFGPGLAGGAATSYANAAVEIREEGETYVARIKDPYADQREFSEAFRALGLNVELRVIPVSPSAVGEIVSLGGGLAGTPLNVPFGARKEPADCDLADSGCFMVVTVPAGIKGKPGVMHFELGRQAKPGESYENDWQSVTRPGEPLAGVKVSGRTVEDVLAEVTKRGLAAEFRRVVVHEGGYEVKPLAADEVGGDWIVFKVTPARAGVVTLEVTAERQTGLAYVD